MEDVASGQPLFLERERITYYQRITVIDLEGFLHAVTQIIIFAFALRLERCLNIPSDFWVVLLVCHLLQPALFLYRQKYISLTKKNP